MKYSLALHGGAGAIKKTDEEVEPYRQALQRALAAGEDVLRRGGSALEAVVATVTVLEDDPLFNAGRGAVFTEDGVHELDAAVMEGHTLKAGAVAGVRRVRNPVAAALAVMNAGRSVLLAGDGADRFAAQQGLAMVAPDYFSTAFRREQLRKARAEDPTAQHIGHNVAAGTGLPGASMGTVGAVARDKAGHLAVATSTGGRFNKQAGRLGDTPVIGAGTYASARCAVSATGDGELFMRRCAAYDVDARMRYLNLSLFDAVKSIIHDESQPCRLEGGIIAIDWHGNICLHQTARMYRAAVVEGFSHRVAVYENTPDDDIKCGDPCCQTREHTTEHHGTETP